MWRQLNVFWIVLRSVRMLSQVAHEASSLATHSSGHSLALLCRKDMHPLITSTTGKKTRKAHILPRMPKSPSIILARCAHAARRITFICLGTSCHDRPVEYSQEQNVVATCQARATAHVLADVQCNKIRVVHQKARMVVTHSDCAELFVWDFEKQPDYNLNTKVSTTMAHSACSACAIDIDSSM